MNEKAIQSQALALGELPEVLARKLGLPRGSVEAVAVVAIGLVAILREAPEASSTAGEGSFLSISNHRPALYRAARDSGTRCCAPVPR
jgi:hypothetical protein